MSTSDRMVVFEALVGAAVVVTAVGVVADDVWMPGSGVHPGWLPVIVLAARYGPRGLFWALAAVVGGLAAVDVARGGDLAGLAARGHSGPALLALVAATLVAWIGMLHETRTTRALARVATATALQAEALATEQALHDNLGYLRGRLDRLDLSVSVWRELATRLEHGNLAEAADAALELCMMRTGARAGRVHLRDGDSLTMVAGRGPWPTSAVRSHDQGGDATVRAALLARQVTVGAVAATATATDSEVAAPVVDDGSGVVLALIALRGIPDGRLRAGELVDLAIVAQWLAPALTRPQPDLPRQHVVTDRERVTVRYRPAIRRGSS